MLGDTCSLFATSRNVVAGVAGVSHMILLDFFLPDLTSLQVLRVFRTIMILLDFFLPCPYGFSQ